MTQQQRHITKSDGYLGYSDRRTSTGRLRAWVVRATYEKDFRVGGGWRPVDDPDSYFCEKTWGRAARMLCADCMRKRGLLW